MSEPRLRLFDNPDGDPKVVWWTPELEREILPLVAQGLTYKVITGLVGIPRGTLSKWLRLGEGRIWNKRTNTYRPAIEPYATFSIEFRRAEAAFQQQAIQAWTAQFARDYRAVKEFMERRFPADWRIPDPESTKVVPPVTINIERYETTQAAAETVSQRPAVREALAELGFPEGMTDEDYESIVEAFLEETDE